MAYFNGKQILFSPKIITTNYPMFDKWLKGEPYDLVIDDAWTEYFDLALPNLKEQTVKGNVTTSINVNNFFDDCVEMTSCILPNCTCNARFIFKGCAALKNVELAAATTAAGVNAALWHTTFTGCVALENVKLGAGSDIDIYLYYSDNLTQECLVELIKGVADLTGKTAQTFWVGDINKARIPEEYQTMLTKKNWILK
jgi:hypothetical protein